MHILKCALAGAAFSTTAVISGAITWTLVQGHQDKKHNIQHWQKRRLEAAIASHPPAIPLPRQSDVSESAELEKA